MAGSNFVAFRVDDDLAEAIANAVAESGMSKTDWLTEAIVYRLGIDTPENRLNTIADRLENVTALISSSLSVSNEERKQPEPRREVLTKQLTQSHAPTKKSPQKRTGELSEAEKVIIELEDTHQGKSNINQLISDHLNGLCLLTVTGKEWDALKVRDTKSRMKKRGNL
ncbi:hypothetical protein [Rosenbergiella epipactidis]|uniref:hypothetical protein n=1 Tax=Rosenbergiella epipactidis TaxID=1544694 RepID=UPI001F4D6E68|nr:hypothetical protein [Rosenbergiella epipactidis]